MRISGFVKFEELESAFWRTYATVAMALGTKQHTHLTASHPLTMGVVTTKSFRQRFERTFYCYVCPRNGARKTVNTKRNGKAKTGRPRYCFFVLRRCFEKVSERGTQPGSSEKIGRRHAISYV